MIKTIRPTVSRQVPLSKTVIPFNALCWVDLDHELVKRYPNKRYLYAVPPWINRSKTRITAINVSPTSLHSEYRFKIIQDGRVLFDIAGLVFDEIPLSYLDWLMGQPWIKPRLANGNPNFFYERLQKYLAHPVIQRQLDREAIYESDDIAEINQNRCFIPSEENEKHKWNGQTMPKEEQEFFPISIFQQFDKYDQAETQPVSKMTRYKAYELLADALEHFENPPNDKELDFDVLRKICDLVERKYAKLLRSKWIDYKRKVAELPIKDLLEQVNEMLEAALQKPQISVKTIRKEAKKHGCKKLTTEDFKSIKKKLTYNGTPEQRRKIRRLLKAIS